MTGTTLHLVGKLGFSTDDKQLKRAGLDYWHALSLHYHEDFTALAAAYPGARFFLATTKAARLYTEPQYLPDDFLIFGKETAGLPAEILQAHPESHIRIPMGANLRSLNLANSVAIVLYEALRQQGFTGLS